MKLSRELDNITEQRPAVMTRDSQMVGRMLMQAVIC